MIWHRSRSECPFLALKTATSGYGFNVHGLLMYIKLRGLCNAGTCSYALCKDQPVTIIPLHLTPYRTIFLRKPRNLPFRDIMPVPCGMSRPDTTAYGAIVYRPAVAHKDNQLPSDSTHT